MHAQPSGHCDCSTSGSHHPAHAAGAPITGAALVRYRIDNMDCPTEEALIRSRLEGMDGVLGLDFNLMGRILTVHHCLASLQLVEEALAAIGMRAVREDGAQAVVAPTRKPRWWPLGLALLLAGAAEVVYWLQDGNSWLVMALSLAAIALGGLSTYRKGWIALKNRNLNINALMSIAVTGALLIGHWPEAAMVMVLFALAELIEARSLERARNAIGKLLELAPQQATVQQADGSWQVVEAAQVSVGSRVRVRPGERIALDGEVVAGRSTVNQAPITGESLPVEKTIGDPVFAGTINESGSFELRVSAPAGQSTLARIIHAVEQAQASRAPTQRFVDQFARWYTPAVFALAVTVALLPPLLMAGAWLDWIYRALVLLVVACPCALVISTPVTIVSGLAAAARQGILIKGGAYLESGHRLRWLALDKTGTVTHGKPRQTDFIAIGEQPPLHSRSLAASLGQRSDHPVSRAIASAAQADGVPLHEVTGFEALAGIGVCGEIDGIRCQLGNRRLLEEADSRNEAIEQQVEALEAQGKSVVLLLADGRVRGLFAVADTIRDSSRQAVSELHGLGIRTLMLSGDNPHVARIIADQAGIDLAEGNLLPANKVREIERLGHGGKVGMVGDGINDAPALARADIGFAMGVAGTDVAIETADVALMDDDLRKIPAFVRLSRATRRVLAQNITLALGIKSVFLILTFTGDATMWMAVFADMGASLLVVANGLRLLRHGGQG